MANNFAELKNETIRICSSIESISDKLERESNYIQETMNHVHRLFGDQEAGLNLIQAMAFALGHTQSARQELFQVIDSLKQEAVFLGK